MSRKPAIQLLVLFSMALLPGAMQAPTNAGINEAGSMGYRDAVVLGVVEGVTEYLPISSTGHLLLTNVLLGLDSDEPLPGRNGLPLHTRDGRVVTTKMAADAYAIIIQAGAILAVLILYWPRVWQAILGVIGLNPNGRRLARNLVVAFLPAAVLGLLLDDWIESMLFSPIPIAIALVAGGILMLAVESWRKGLVQEDEDLVDLHTLGVRQCLFIGLLQCVAMWPGTSRSMMTIVGGYIAGLKPARAAEFSFLLGLITLSAAAGYRALTHGPNLLAAVEPGPMVTGILVAFVSAAVAVKWLVAYLGRHGLALFAWYRFLLAALVVYFQVR